MAGRRRDLKKESFWRRMVRLQAASGLSVRGWCGKHRVREAAFYWWRRELVRREVWNGKSAFVPVHVTGDRPRDADPQIEMVLTDGRRVRVTGSVDGQVLAAPGLLSYVMVSKYGDHLPLHRLERILKRHGLEIARSTMCDWAAQSAEVLKPLYDLMVRQVRDSKIIHTDDTPVKVQSGIDPGADAQRFREQLVSTRYRLRQELAGPRLAQLKTWLESQQAERGGPVLPKSPMGQAIQYAINQWDALCVYTTDDRLSIDNNAAENALRRVALGRKNWLFRGSDKGGRTAATRFSLIATCQRHKVEPMAYLRDVLTRIAATPISQLDQLLPDRWQPLDQTNPS